MIIDFLKYLWNCASGISSSWYEGVKQHFFLRYLRSLREGIRSHTLFGILEVGIRQDFFQFLRMKKHVKGKSFDDVEAVRTVSQTTLAAIDLQT